MVVVKSWSLRRNRKAAAGGGCLNPNPITDSVEPKTGAARLTGGRLLVRGAVFNAAGQVLPLAAALICIPLLVDGMGAARYGILALAFAVIGYFSLFDLGLGRALTQFVAQRLGVGDLAELATGVWTALAIMLAFGLLGGALLLLVAPWLVSHTLTIPADLEGEAFSAVGWISATIPAVTVSAGFRGVLEAYQRFGWINAVRIPVGVVTFVGPLAVLPFANDLGSVMAVIAAAIYGSTLAFAILCLRLVPELGCNVGVRLALLGRLLRFGAWISVSNVVGPLMVYMDRFLIGGLLTVSAVTYYTTSYDAVTRLWVVPAALSPVLFPAFATLSSHGGDRVGALLQRGVRFVFVVLYPLTLIVVVFAQAGLSYWLGEDFALRSTRVLQVLAVGVLINSLAHIPFALVQGYGRADWTAKLHIAELPIYLVAVWLLVEHAGIVGAAIAWTVRVAVDAGAVFVMSGRLLRGQPGRRKGQAGAITLSILALAIAFFLPTREVQVIFVVVGIPVFAVLAWSTLISREERQFVLRFMREGRSAQAADGGTGGRP